MCYFMDKFEILYPLQKKYLCLNAPFCTFHKNGPTFTKVEMNITLMPLNLNTLNVVHTYLSFTIFYFWLNDIQRLIGDKDILIDQNDLDLLRERLRTSVYPTTVFLPVLCFKMSLKTEIKIGKMHQQFIVFFY